jgi:hypothetical protein
LDVGQEAVIGVLQRGLFAVEDVLGTGARQNGGDGGLAYVPRSTITWTGEGSNAGAAFSNADRNSSKGMPVATSTRVMLWTWV